MSQTTHLDAQLQFQLKQLRLSGILATLDARHRQAIDAKWSYVEFLERLLEDEVERRAQKQLALRLHRAAVNTTKTLESFDWSFNPSLNRQLVLQLASGDYLRRKWSDPDFVDCLAQARPVVWVGTVRSYVSGATYPSAECRRCRL